MAEIPSLVSFTVVDKYGIPAQIEMNIEVDNTKTIDQLQTDLSSMLTTIAPLTQGVITRVKYILDEPTDLDPSTALGDVEKGALFNFANATDRYAYPIYIPDVNPSILNSNGLIDLTNTDVTGFITAVTTASTVITVVTKGVRALTGLIDALISFRKHRKPLARKTKEL